MRSEPSRLWTTNADRIPLEQAQAPHQTETLLPVHDHGKANAARPVVQCRARARHLAFRGTRRSTDSLGDDDGAAALTRRTHTRHGRPRQSQDRPGSTDRNMDKVGDRDARRRLGGARRAVGLGGDRRLSSVRSASAYVDRRRPRPDARASTACSTYPDPFSWTSTAPQLVGVCCRSGRQRSGRIGLPRSMLLSGQTGSSETRSVVDTSSKGHRSGPDP